MAMDFHHFNQPQLRVINPVVLATFLLATATSHAGPSAGIGQGSTQTAAEQEVGRACLHALRALVPDFSAMADRFATEASSASGHSSVGQAATAPLQVEFNWGKSQRPLARCTWGAPDGAAGRSDPMETRKAEASPQFQVWLRTADLYVLRVTRLGQEGEQVLYPTRTDSQ